MTSPMPPPAATTPPPWHRLSPEDILARLAATADGLTANEAATRLAAQGPNTLQQRRKAHPIRILARQFQSIIVWVLIGAGIRVIMITGDHPKTALAVARELGIDAAPAPITGADLDRLWEPELRQKSAIGAILLVLLGLLKVIRKPAVPAAP